MTEVDPDLDELLAQFEAHRATMLASLRQVGVCPQQIERIVGCLDYFAEGRTGKTITVTSMLLWELQNLRYSAVDALAAVLDE